METLRAVCTIVDPAYLPQATVAIESARKHLPADDYFILLTTRQSLPAFKPAKLLNLDGLLQDETARLIYFKHKGDELRWSLKPCLLSYLLRKYGQVAYVDSDVLFTADSSSLWEFKGTLLTPHWRKADNKFAYLHGLYNAGFIATSDPDAMQWWAALCAAKCDNNPAGGFFVDQRYLDLLPIYYEATISKDKRANVAPWNDNRIDPLFVHLCRRFGLEGLDKYAALYDTQLELAKASCPEIKPQQVFMIARKVEGGFHGPEGGKVYTQDEAELALSYYQAGLFGKGVFEIRTLPYSGKNAPNNDACCS